MDQRGEVLVTTIDRRNKKEPQKTTGVVLRESNNAFQTRSERFGGRFNQDRAVTAFKEYITQRNRMTKSDSRSSRPLQAPRSATQEYNEPQGGEVFFACADAQEAMQRVTELIGPIPQELRNTTYLRLGEKVKNLREQGMPTPVNGFTASVPVESARGEQLVWHKAWRLDYSETEGCHFNVVVRPPIIEGGQQVGNYGSIHPNALNIAFTFPGNESDYESLIDTVYDNAIVSLYETESDNRDIDYLPLHT